VKFTIVTPSFNHGSYFRTAIESVLSQNYTAVDYIVMDGGSTDGSAEIIKEYAGRLHGWRSAPDGGQYAAVQEGFGLSDGEIMGWLNADDFYLPWTFRLVARIFDQFPEIEWITSRFAMVCDAFGIVHSCHPMPGFNKDDFAKGENLGGLGLPSTGYIQQEATFWRRRLWDAAGASFDKGLSLAADFELWSRFFDLAPLVAVDAPLAVFRRHDRQRSQEQSQAYLAEARSVLERKGKIDWDVRSAKVRVLAKSSFPPEMRQLGISLGLFQPSKRLVYDPEEGKFNVVSY